MSLADTELTIGKTKLKGIWIAIVITIGTSIGGTAFTASTLYSRLETVEARSIPNIQPLQESITLIQQELKDNNVSQLQGKLAELGVNLATIAKQQEKLLEIQTEVTELRQKVAEMESTVTQAKLLADNMSDLDSSIEHLKSEADSLWLAVDYLGNPLK
tara:strand:- start:1788 stop:2264 length:477 start_codon:yes stop_codon:yes gene_type:complete